MLSGIDVNTIAMNLESQDGTYSGMPGKHL